MGLSRSFHHPPRILERQPHRSGAGLSGSSVTTRTGSLSQLIILHRYLYGTLHRAHSVAWGGSNQGWKSALSYQQHYMGVELRLVQALMTVRVDQS